MAKKAKKMAKKAKKIVEELDEAVDEEEVLEDEEVVEKKGKKENTIPQSERPIRSYSGMDVN